MHATRSPRSTARVHVAVTALAALVVIVGGTFTVAALLYHGMPTLGAVASAGTFAAYFFTSRLAFDALDRLGDLRRIERDQPTPAAEIGVELHRAIEQTAELSRLAPPAQSPGRHRPETFARTSHLPAVASAGARS
ncbi:hypothetical protein [Pseudonocardia sp. McavD-2-B]|uniref:hypothetical protein n=1 Tax=Pseudonocardia sp. McavD-2-B TaxID=2954499 RepID=UPI002097E1CF|nr:hypothetical protein [Pseudonocardia sp. McavD-2-B]MCO7192297.1 hypothetical protein [Pseudonocardia sp. McavD-2-B]